MEILMPKLTLLVGPPGSGKSTFAKKRISEDGDLGAATVYVNQDSQGKGGHQEIFRNAVYDKKDIIVDRMGFNKQQRANYLLEAKKQGYETEIIVLHQPYAVCLDRVLKRIGNHETIMDEKGARSALQLFFTKYERPEQGEADKLTFIYPEWDKYRAIICDLDGTLCNVDHRIHHVRPPKNVLVGPDGSMVDVLGTLDPVPLDKPLPKFKKNWAAFFAGIPKDEPNLWCLDLLRNFAWSSVEHLDIVFCSGRDDNQRKMTVEWLDRVIGDDFGYDLYMRNRNDSRQDAIVKEIILDFEILTRYEPVFMIDDRQQVVDMWRKRGFTCLQCAKGDF